MTDREEKLKGIRECLEWLEANQEVQVHTVGFHAYISGANPKEQFIEHARAMGKADKEFIESNLFLYKNFPGGVEYWVAGPREAVCERVVVGVKKMPAHEAYTIPAAPDREVDIVEWRCGSLMRPSDVVTADVSGQPGVIL